MCVCVQGIALTEGIGQQLVHCRQLVQIPSSTYVHTRLVGSSCTELAHSIFTVNMQCAVCHLKLRVLFVAEGTLASGCAVHW